MDDAQGNLYLCVTVNNDKPTGSKKTVLNGH